MNKIYNDFFDETYYHEVLKNGLEVLIFSKPDFQTTSACFGTPYGALNINEKHLDKEYNFNPGIAHFLEHKLFEAEGKDILNQFSYIGSNVNAFTSYKETVYYFSRSDEDIEESLNLLLDFVQDLDISEESVEKEKPIICQELSMYLQNPDSRLINETFKSLYKNYPLKYDIGGDDKTVNKITKDELETCYAINYHPSNMVLVITTPIDPYKIIKIVEDNQNKKDFKLTSRPVANNLEEPVEVVRNNYCFEMDVANEKICYAIKIKANFKDNNEARTAEWAMRLYLSAYFTSVNKNYQKWLDKGLINDYFGFEVDFSTEYAYILFYNEYDKEDVFKKLIDDELKEDLLTDELLEQMKRRAIGGSFKAFNDVESFTSGYIRNYLSKVDYFKEIDQLMNLDLKQIKDIYHSFDYSNYAIIHITNSGKH